MKNVDVLIIGAGQAGMAAANRLLDQGYENVHVLEAHAHVGGRTRNVNAANTAEYDTATDNVIELGGTWISPNHSAILDLCRELDIDVFRASFIDTDDEARTACEDDESDDDQEYPWWYWGADYSPEEMRLMKKTIFHQCIEDESVEEQEHDKLSFRTPSELTSQMEPNTLLELERLGTVLDDYSTSLDDLSWDATSPGVKWSEVDCLSTGAKLSSILQTNGAKNILQSVIHNKNAEEPEQVSFLYNLLSFKGCNSSGPDSEYRVRGGTQAIPLAIADKLGSDRLTLGDAVTEVCVQSAEEFSSCDCDHPIKVTTKSGRVFTAKAVILTGSPPAILGIHFDPPLPAVQAQLLQRMPMGTSRKFIAIYKNGPWWRDYGYTGDVLALGLPGELSISIGTNASTGQEERVPIFGQCFDTSPYSQKYGVLTCFVEGRQNLYFSNLDEEKQQDLMLQFLKLSLGDLLDDSTAADNDNKPQWEPDSLVTYNWADDPYARGAYTAYFPPGVLSVPEWWEAYREMEKLPNVFLAGADHHVGFGNGFMEGAVRSGQCAADLVMERLNRYE